MFLKYRFNRFKRHLRARSLVKARWNLPDISLLSSTNLINKNILIATSTGSNWPCSSFDSLLASALTLRGCNVSFLICDGILPACQECDSQWISSNDVINNNIKSVCKDCYKPAKNMLEPLGIKIHKYSDFISSDKINDINNSQIFNYNDENTKAGTCRYFGIGQLKSSKHKTVFNQYYKANLITKEVINNLISIESPDIAIVHHGIYVPQGIISDELSKKNIKTYVWGPSYRKGTVLFCHDQTYHHAMISEDNSLWENYDFKQDDNKRLMKYINNKYTGNNDWISFQSGKKQSKIEIYNKYNLDPNKKVIGLLTNVIWDAQLHFKNSCFNSMLDWLFYTIDYFKEKQDTQLLIRIHPAEIHGTVPSNQKVFDEIQAKYKSLPINIKIIKPEDDTSTYSAMDVCNTILVYGTKTAIELSTLGKCVIVSGESWARGKGFTIDIESIDDYQNKLENIHKYNRLSDDLIIRAKKYAYYLFFKRMIPVKALKPLKKFGPYQVSIDKISELEPGNDKGLDTICNAIINNKEFIYDE